MNPIVGFALLALSAALSLDNVGAGLALGLGGIDLADRLRVLAVFGTVTVLALAIGLLVGTAAAPRIGTAGRIVGGLILLVIGIEAVIQGTNQRYGSVKDVGRLLMTAGSVNIDSLLSGVAVGVGDLPAVATIAMVATVTTAATMLALEVGGRVTGRVQRRGRPIGGALLLLVAIGLMTGFIK